MKNFNFFFIFFIVLFSQAVYSQPDLILGNNVPNQKFILHTRPSQNGDFFQLTADDGGTNWLWNEGISFVRSTGNVGIGTTSPTGKFTVRGGIHLQQPNDPNLRLTMGYYKSEMAEYGFLSALDYGDPLTGKPLILNGKGTGEAWGNVGIGQLFPIQALDIGGRLNIRKGVIQNYDPEAPEIIDGTEDLGLYSTRQGFNIRIVTKSAPIQFYTDGGTNVIGGTPTMVVHQSGVVGIGTSNPSDGVTSNLKLAVNGTIKAKEIKVTPNNWSDFVFKSDYKLLSLSEVETYIKENGHLPEIPSEQEVIENGVELGDMTSKLLQKVEELMLYVIEQKKEIEKLKEENRSSK